MQCYCNSIKDYNQCCEPIILGKRKAETAEELMRSRYSAYVVADVNYLLNSHYKLTRPTKERKSILKWTKSVKWIKLEVILTQKGLSNDQNGFVEFRAWYEEHGKEECIHEYSYFIKENNQWFYMSGELK